MMKTIECDERYGGVLAWSRIDPKPVLVHDTKTGQYITCWNGAAFPRRVGLVLAAKFLFGLYPSPSVVKELAQECAGLKMKLNLSKVENSIAAAILILRNNTEDRKDVLRWFDKRNAMEV
jgi:hypothetical protein